MSPFRQVIPQLDKPRLRSMLQARFGDDAIVRLSDLPDPFTLKGMEEASGRIAQAIAAKERIVLIGDYDVDGVSASVIVKEFFDRLGYPLEVVIPNRFSDGYGISPKVLDRIEADVIITVDNGISAVEAAELCLLRGMDLIITDHHTAPEILPKAFAIVNPKQPGCAFSFKEICGATVAWYLVAALKKRLNASVDMGAFLDILAIATIADAVPLVSINRVVVKAGLKMMATSTRPAMVAFRDKLDKKEFNSEDVGFAIAPKLNAAGRMNSAMEAYAFLTASTPKEAARWLEYLWQLNQQRKEVEAEITAQAKEMVNPEDKIIIVWGEGWHEGVIGIVASRLVDAFKLPAIVFSLEKGRAKGSARSVGDVDIYDLISRQSGLLEGFGGHKQAAGLSITEANLETFKAAVNAQAEQLRPESFIPEINVIGIMPFDDLDAECFDIIQQFEPYGMANPRPLFFAEEARVHEARRVGSTEDHLMLFLSPPSGQEPRKAMAFFCDRDIIGGDRVSCVFALVKNEFRNSVSYEFQIKEFI